MVPLFNTFLRSRFELPEDLKTRVREYFTTYYSTGGKIFDESSILAKLSPNLAKEIHTYNERDLFYLVPLLGRAPGSFCNRIAVLLEPHVQFASRGDNDNFFEEGTKGEEMYFILSGICEISLRGEVIKTIGHGCYFGDVAVILGCKRTATVRSKTNSVLFVIKRDQLLHILDDFEHIQQYMTFIAQKRRLRLAYYNGEDQTAFEPSPRVMVDDEDALTKFYVEHRNIHKQEIEEFCHARRRSRLLQDKRVELFKASKTNHSMKDKSFSKSLRDLFASEHHGDIPAGALPVKIMPVLN